jgi:YidC/Oxa1 family membrane protein insertase
MLIQMPIWLSLYRALFHLANDTTSLNEGFLWIPSLAGPVGPITNGMSGSATWMLPWSDAFLGWPDSLAYLVLPVLLVVSQIYMQKTMTPQSDDPQQKMMGQMMMFMPFMFGYFALVVPAGLSVYWITSNLLGVVQQKYFTQIKENNDKNSASDSSKTSQTPSLEMSPATASIENSSDSEGQVSNNARRKSRSKKRRRKK